MKLSFLPVFVIFQLFSGFTINLNAQSFQELVESGKQKQKAGKFAPAEKDLTSAINTIHSDVIGHFKWWSAYNQMNNFERVSLETKAPDIKTEWAEPYYLRGLCYGALGKKDQAIRDLQLALQIDTAHAPSLYELGIYSQLDGKKEEGCIFFRKSADLGYEKAQEKYETGFCWTSSFTFYRNGVTQWQLKQYENAIREFSMAILLNPDSANAFTKRGLSYTGLGKHDIAIRDHSIAIGMDPKNPEYFLNRGLSYNAAGKYQEAFDDFSKAIAINSRYYEAYVNRAISCMGLGFKSSALYDYSKAMSIKPSEGSLYYNTGVIKRDMNDKKGACVDFKKASELGYDEAEKFAENCK